MKSKSILHRLALVAGISLAAQSLWAAEVEAGFRSLFNGQDLAGWDGDPKLWSVKDGAITGQTTPENPAKGNTFLIWKDGTPADFELRFSYRLVPNNDKGFANSGVQYRSKVVDQPNWVVGGYQADMEAGPTYTGILYEERGRGILAQRGQKVIIKEAEGKTKIDVVGEVGKSDEIQAAIKKEDWNDYVVIAQGNHLIQRINDRVTVDVTDEQETKAAKAGVLALQLHAGQPMTVQFRNLRIKLLSGPGVSGSDLDRMQGDWGVGELVMNGEKISADALASAKLKIKASEYFLEGDHGSSHGTLKLGESDTPKLMDVSTDDGTQLPAIYEIAGDNLKVCYAVNGASRPKEFKSAEGSDHVFASYKRKAK
jgi:uncharacterized protein (TIGR03067 family)